MRRRQFLTFIGGASLWSLTARARSVAKVGYLGAGSPDDAFAAFEAGMSALGYDPGKSVEILARFGTEQYSRLLELARELIDLRVDVLVTYGPGIFAARELSTKVPIVAVATADAVDEGLADSLAHPGGNVTGQTMFYSELIVKRIELLKEARPAITSIGLLLPAGLSFTLPFFRPVEAAAKSLGVDIAPAYAAKASDSEAALDAIPGAEVGGLVISDQPIFIEGSGPAEIAAAVSRRRLPAAGSSAIARAGGLFGYGVDYLQMFRHAAAFVDKILRGAQPGDIPFERVTRFEMIINLKTARALGLDLPPSLLAGADAVIE